MTTQYLRKVGLVVSVGSKGLDLSNMRIVFRTQQQDADAPNTAVIRVYNLAESTAKSIQTEYQQVSLQAGYEGGNFGLIFAGTIAQVKRGRESAIDSYVEIYASDGDQAYNFAFCNRTLAAGSSPQDRASAIAQSMDPYLSQKGITIPQSVGTGGTLPRGKVLFALARDPLSDLTQSVGCTWSIQNGQVVVIPLTGYAPGEAVVLNADTGMIGIPESTNNGIQVSCLLNPKIKLGTRIQIDNRSINTTTVRQQGIFPRYGDLSFPATVTNDGFYRALVVEHSGDNWSTGDWTTHLTCLAIDPSASPDKSVDAYG